jgi:phosphoribosyl 1,2-cyclic phosphodiesterase/FixJ family two-component response regulator
MRVKFWGTRGSIAVPGPHTTRYGGNTACVEVRAANGALVVIDGGTGAYALGQRLVSEGGANLRGHILISHTHWDHIQGIPFFAPLFVPGNEWDIYGPKGLDKSLRETLAGQMQYTYFPVTPDQFAARISYHDLVEGVLEIDGIRVSTQYLNHPALTLGYRLEVDGATIVYCCDHEPFSREAVGGPGTPGAHIDQELSAQDLRHVAFIRDCDLLIHDGQYTAAEYSDHIGWGHSPAEYVVRMARQAGVKRLALTHHDPHRNDDAVDRMLESLREIASPLEVFAAAEGQSLEFAASSAEPPEHATAEFPATALIQPALVERAVLLSVADPVVAALLSEAVHAEGLQCHLFDGIDEARALIHRHHPSLVLLEHDLPRADGLMMCRAIRAENEDQVPVVVISAQEDLAVGAECGVTEWLVRPFSASFARTKIRAWVLRTACHWMRGAIPQDEGHRLAALRGLEILDTAPEDRFDRVTRLAKALFDVPMAMISLVDEDRQWFKSCQGLSVQETSRDAAFCAHVVYHRAPMVIPDTFDDERFADNPFVVGDPRIRFYAGYPLILSDGNCMGTLCLLDTRPRSMAAPDIERLHDLADIALKELSSA